MRKVLFASLAMAFAASCERRPSKIASEYPAEVTAIDTKGGKGLPYLVGRDMRPAWQIQGGPAPRELGAFEVTDQSGRKVTTESLRGKISVVSFFFTHCPGICPATIHNLMAIQEKFLKNDKVAMLSFSITPEQDTPSVLSEFSQEHGIDSRRWSLLTGKRDVIYRLARESFEADTYSPREDKMKKLKAQDFLHSENVYLVDGEQKLRGVYLGRSPASIEELARDIEVLAR